MREGLKNLFGLDTSNASATVWLIVSDLTLLFSAALGIAAIVQGLWTFVLCTGLVG